jgi:hypothetical protein
VEHENSQYENIDASIYQGQYLLGKNTSAAHYLPQFGYSIYYCRIIDISVLFFWLSTCSWCFIEAFQDKVNYFILSKG